MLQAGTGDIWRLYTSQKWQKRTHEKQATISQGRNPKRMYSKISTTASQSTCPLWWACHLTRPHPEGGGGSLTPHDPSSLDSAHWARAAPVWPNWNQSNSLSQESGTEAQRWGCADSTEHGNRKDRLEWEYPDYHKQRPRTLSCWALTVAKALRWGDFNVKNWPEPYQVPRGCFKPIWF